MTSANMDEHKKLVGGVFGLEWSIEENPSLLRPNDVLFLNARSAILTLVNCLRPATVWMPSYLCPTMLNAVGIAQIPIHFFSINDHLEIENDAWISQVRAGDLVVIIDYFGFCTAEGAYEAIRNCGAWSLEDACQALLSTRVGQQADFVVYSPRKYIGVPDGGILRCRDSLPMGAEKMKPPLGWWLKAFGACLQRREFDKRRLSKDRKWFQLFREAESEMPVGNYGASELSINLLDTAVAWDLVRSRRRQNYQVLLDNLEDYAFYKTLPDDVVPLGFPITVDNRDELQRILADQEIYPPVHWELSNRVPEEFVKSHRLSGHILTLICDQRYSRGDMERTARIVRAASPAMLS